MAVWDDEYVEPPNKKYWFYFFLNGELHKRLKINKARNLLLAWNYPQNKRIQYLYTDVMKNKEQAYTTKEVSGMLNRRPRYINNLIYKKILPRPATNFQIPRQPGEPPRRGERFYYSESMVKLMREYFAEQHIGRPRQDKWKVSHAPAEWELRQMLEKRRRVYAVDDDGEMIPVWHEYN